MYGPLPVKRSQRLEPKFDDTRHMSAIKNKSEEQEVADTDGDGIYRCKGSH
jgi:hypothetical protein